MAHPRSRTAVVVPVRSFAGAKARLATVLAPHQRAALVRALAGRVVAAAGSAPVIVVTADPEVARWAEGIGAHPLADDGSGLDRAAAAGVARAAEWGHLRAAVVHADLPLVADLAPVLQGEGVVIAPDRTGDGTNAIALPTGAAFGFSYGPGSFARHRAEASRAGLVATVVNDATLAFDVDTPRDLADLAALHHDIAIHLPVPAGPVP